MKILFSDATLLHGGAERVISILANEFAKMGHDVGIILYYDKPIWYEIDSRVRIVNDEMFIGKSNPLKHILFRHNFFKKSDADIVVSFLAPINMINIIACAFTGKKIIVADRNDPRKVPVNNVLRRSRDILYCFANGIVLQSHNNKSYFSKIIREKSKVIFNPVDVGEYRGIALKTEKSDEIIYVGRLIDQKNPFMLLEAFYEIQKNMPTYKLIYYGDGILLRELKIRAEQLGILRKVVFKGAVKNVFDCIKSAKLFVMTSNYEGMPNALIEAMCVGVPVISTKVSGAVDLIEDGVNGCLIPCGDVDKLKEVIEKMLNNYSQAEMQAQNAIKLNELLKAQQITDDWLKFIEEIISKP